MQTLKGMVANLNRSTHVSGSSSSVMTTNVAVFELSGQPVTLKATASLIINEGDEFAVAGEKGKDGVFKAYAYRNITKGVHGGSSGMAVIVISIFLLTTPLFACALMRIGGAAAGGLLCLIPFFLIGAAGGGILLFFALKQRNAWKAVA